MSELENPARRKSTLFLANEMIVSLQESGLFWRAFKSVKFDSEDGDQAEDERVVIIVAKGDTAARLSAVYDAVVADLPEGSRDDIT